ncbi:hypothetical protein CENSYa_1030 [Cenarchaeum symbiosum A]|uniref:Uncharacterized protein n=1 Tax=Cenarchaeum symbiosum (strain A) TaxID=414004 RepID=A0RWE4_CENSY|nr:hypothetical protein CENSYa_1030 [Cenarchaeum symbiosum A]
MNLGGYAVITGLAAVLALAIMPSEGEVIEGAQMYGMAEIVQRDASGIVLSQVIHNQVLDDGEELILHAVFDTDQDPLGSSQRVSVLCPTNEAFDETTSANLLGPRSSILMSSGNTCRADSSVGIVNGTATIGPIDFPFETSGFNSGTVQIGSNFFDHIPINTVAVCARDAINTADITCNNSGNVFAAIDTSGVQFRDGDTLTITYTFDISSPMS